MSSPRFATVRGIYEAFPTAESDVGVAPSDEEPLAFLRRLAEGQAWNAALSFCCYLLPRREAVWWGCQSLKLVRREMKADEIEAVQAAEAWVRDPSDDVRRAALKLAMLGDTRLPGIWMAFAAGWSGGSIVPVEFGQILAAPEQTARGVRAGLLIALANTPPEEMQALAMPCLSSCVAMVRGQSQAG